MDHDFARCDSQFAFLARRKSSKPHPFDEEVLTLMLAWLHQAPVFLKLVL